MILQNKVLILEILLSPVRGENRILHLGSSVTIEFFTFRNGQTDGNGGAIYAQGGVDPIIRKKYFSSIIRQRTEGPSGSIWAMLT